MLFRSGLSAFLLTRPQLGNTELIEKSVLPASKYDIVVAVMCIHLVNPIFPTGLEGSICASGTLNVISFHASGMQDDMHGDRKGVVWGKRVKMGVGVGGGRAWGWW